MKKNSNINIRKLYVVPEVEVLQAEMSPLMDATATAPDVPAEDPEHWDPSKSNSFEYESFYDDSWGEDY